LKNIRFFLSLSSCLMNSQQKTILKKEFTIKQSSCLTKREGPRGLAPVVLIVLAGTSLWQIRLGHRPGERGEAMSMPETGQASERDERGTDDYDQQEARLLMALMQSICAARYRKADNTPCHIDQVRPAPRSRSLSFLRWFPHPSLCGDFLSGRVINGCGGRSRGCAPVDSIHVF
jgi:hypothetical protein